MYRPVWSQPSARLYTRKQSCVSLCARLGCQRTLNCASDESVQRFVRTTDRVLCVGQCRARGNPEILASASQTAFVVGRARWCVWRETDRFAWERWATRTLL
jgi:hypothetical protein